MQDCGTFDAGTSRRSHGAPSPGSLEHMYTFPSCSQDAVAVPVRLGHHSSSVTCSMFGANLPTSTLHRPDTHSGPRVFCMCCFFILASNRSVPCRAGAMVLILAVFLSLGSGLWMQKYEPFEGATTAHKAGRCRDSGCKGPGHELIGKVVHITTRDTASTTILTIFLCCVSACFYVCFGNWCRRTSLESLSADAKRF